MTNYWEQLFKNEGTLWKHEPSDSAIITADLFYKEGIKNILIPGIGYGRNTLPFINKGMHITGIEISESAITLARESGLDFIIHPGSVLDMPFDTRIYSGIFCYALLHIFDDKERKQILRSCYKQLSPGGFMVFTVISTKSTLFGNGVEVEENRFRLDNGISVFFYNPGSIHKEFKDFGLIEFKEIDEPIKFTSDQPSLKCYIVKCRK